jgi:cyclic beta-1,2-glucan synthetase
MGSGDWNDGMNRVGNEGRGESVWLGWFLCQVLADFIPVAQQRGEAARAARWQRAALDLKDALVNQAWDGQWFKRAYFDDGTPLGSKDNTECRIDLIAQAWSVLSKVAPLDLQHLAMAAVQTHLIDSDAGLIKLLEPPLAKAVPSAGYIQAYPPGVRENAGQYSHAGVWALMAQAELASTAPDPAEVGDLVYRYFNYLSPAHRASNAAQASAYGLEPYVMAGDVYTQPPYVGRGGWSWYTGAAAWMHRAAIESIFGLHQRAQEQEFNPCLPRHWTQVELTLLRDERSLHFILLRCEPAALALAAVKWHATVLQPGQPLRWLDLPAKSSFVIPLQPDDTPKPTAPAGH